MTQSANKFQNGTTLLIFKIVKRGCEWANLNHFRTGQGQCAANLAHWRKIPDPSCSCGAAKQTMSHIVNDCPLSVLLLYISLVMRQSSGWACSANDKKKKKCEIRSSMKTIGNCRPPKQHPKCHNVAGQANDEKLNSRTNLRTLLIEGHT